jgi:hypothetical protein
VPPVALSLSLSLSWPHLSQNGGTPLFWACSNGHVNVAEMLLSRGASVDHQGNVSAAPRPVPVPVSLMASSQGGRPPLFVACSYGYPEVIRCLLESGANCQHKNQVRAIAVWLFLSFDRPGRHRWKWSAQVLELIRARGLSACLSWRPSS